MQAVKALVTRGARKKRDDSGGSNGVSKTTELAYRRKIAVLFGCSKYLHWKNLDHGASDAEALAKRFKEVLNFDDVLLILDEEVTKPRIHQVFQDLSACHKQDLIVITWSGHGAPLKLRNGRNTGYLIPYDAPDPLTIKSSFHCVDMIELVHLADTALESLHVVFLIDCCFSGFFSALKRGGKDERLSQGRKRTIDKHLKMRCRYVINAGTKDEQVSDGEGAHSPFVEAILQSKVGRGEDQCSVEDMKTDISHFFENMDDVEQTPTGGNIDGDEGGVAFLALPSEKKGERITFTPADQVPGGSGAKRGSGLNLSRELSERSRLDKQQKYERKKARDEALSHAIADAKISGFSKGKPVHVLIDGEDCEGTITLIDTEGLHVKFETGEKKVFGKAAQLAAKVDEADDKKNAEEHEEKIAVQKAKERRDKRRREKQARVARKAKDNEKRIRERAEAAKLETLRVLEEHRARALAGDTRLDELDYSVGKKPAHEWLSKKTGALRVKPSTKLKEIMKEANITTAYDLAHAQPKVLSELRQNMRLSEKTRWDKYSAKELKRLRDEEDQQRKKKEARAREILAKNDRKRKNEQERKEKERQQQAQLEEEERQKDREFRETNLRELLKSSSNAISPRVWLKATDMKPAAIAWLEENGFVDDFSKIEDLSLMSEEHVNAIVEIVTKDLPSSNDKAEAEEDIRHAFRGLKFKHNGTFSGSLSKAWSCCGEKDKENNYCARKYAIAMAKKKQLVVDENGRVKGYSSHDHEMKTATKHSFRLIRYSKAGFEIADGLEKLVLSAEKLKQRLKEEVRKEKELETRNHKQAIARRQAVAVAAGATASKCQMLFSWCYVPLALFCLLFVGASAWILFVQTSIIIDAENLDPNKGAMLHDLTSLMIVRGTFLIYAATISAAILFQDFSDEGWENFEFDRETMGLLSAVCAGIVLGGFEIGVGDYVSWYNCRWQNYTHTWNSTHVYANSDNLTLSQEEFVPFEILRPNITDLTWSAPIENTCGIRLWFLVCECFLGPIPAMAMGYRMVLYLCALDEKFRTLYDRLLALCTCFFVRLREVWFAISFTALGVAAAGSVPMFFIAAILTVRFIFYICCCCC
jgi:hypothetical protein